MTDTFRGREMVSGLKVSIGRDTWLGKPELSITQHGVLLLKAYVTSRDTLAASLVVWSVTYLPVQYDVSAEELSALMGWTK